MISTNTIKRDLQVDNSTIDFIIDNMPNNGYAVIAGKVGMERQNVRIEIVQRKKLYNAAIINACLEFIEFATGKKVEA